MQKLVNDSDFVLSDFKDLIHTGTIRCTPLVGIRKQQTEQRLKIDLHIKEWIIQRSLPKTQHKIQEP